MGTNYYLVCKHCQSRKVHVGKQSVGWPFLSNYSREEITRIYNSTKMDFFLMDEYGRTRDFDDFMSNHQNWTVEESSDPMDWH